MAMRAIFGQTDLDAGTVPWNGAPIGPAERRRFGYMPEKRGLYPNMLVRDEVKYLGRLHGMSRADATMSARHWIERLEIPNRGASKVDALSHGNQQRMQLAAALVHDPEVLVLDEPLAGRDPARIDTIAGVLQDRARSGCWVLLSSHQLDLVEDICKSVTIIDHGRMMATGSVDALATTGQRRLTVRVEGYRLGEWARKVPGVTVSDVASAKDRLVLTDTTSSDAVLDAARGAERVTQFAFARRRLSEVFREAVMS